MLMKAQSVLKIEEPRGAGAPAWFSVRDEDTGLPIRTVILDPQDFEDLGEPKQITVTIEPGDKIN